MDDDQPFPDHLPYDDVPEDMGSILTQSSNEPSLASRITPYTARLYLLANSTTPVKNTLGKLKGISQGNEAAEDDEVVAADVGYRANALLLQGEPIQHLPTDGIFAYVTQFAPAPLGLEWVDDKTCVILYSSPTLARAARRFLLKDSDADTEPESAPARSAIAYTSMLHEAKDVPYECWPGDDSGAGPPPGLDGAMHMRWAMASDIKGSNAGRNSRWYKKYGENAGKVGYVEQRAKRTRVDDEDEDEDEDESAREKRRALDEQLDAFLAEDAGDDPDPKVNRQRNALDRQLDAYLSGSPPSRERSPPLHGSSYESASQGPDYRRREAGFEQGERREYRGTQRRSDRSGRRGQPKRVDRSQLDAELDAYLNSR